MTSMFPAQCLACTRLRDSRDPMTGATTASTCDAFPSGIPREMLHGGDHRAALPGDSGLRFQMADGPVAAAAFSAWQRFAGRR